MNNKRKFNNVFLCTCLFLSACALIYSGCSDNPTNNSGPNPPVLIYPDSGGSASPDLTFQWHKSAGANSYHLMVSGTINFQNPIIIDQAGLTDTSYQVPNLVLHYGMTYYWRVSAANASGKSGYSSVWKFNTNVEPIYDTNVVIFDTIGVNQYMNNSSLSSVNLFTGVGLSDVNTSRDLQMRSLNNLNTYFYFRDGTFNTPYGYECRFKKIYPFLTIQKFDTISVIPGGLGLSNFPNQSTESYGYFNPNINQGMVMGFYLKGKYDNAVTSHQVFGVLYLMSGSTGISGYTQLIRVKINTAGQNYFKRQ